jgi:hypothetical protein
MNCRFHSRSCDNLNANYLILIGCLNQHITEVPLCTHHTDIWLQTRNNNPWVCGTCGNPIAEYRIIPATKIKPGTNLNTLDRPVQYLTQK